MTKQKKTILFPLVLITALLVYCWTIILTTNIIATWRQYLGITLFLILVLLFFKSIAKTIVATGVYLLLSTFNLLAMSADIHTVGLRFGSVSTPEIQPLSLGLLTLYLFLNLDALINIYLDYKESKVKKL